MSRHKETSDPMLCLACTMPFVASGENCPDKRHKWRKKKKRARPLNNEAKISNLDKKQTVRGQKRDKKRTKQNAEAEWRLDFVFFLLFFQLGLGWAHHLLKLGAGDAYD